MDKTEGVFLEPRFDGGRFKGANGMPVEALSELSAYRALIVEVAKALYRESTGKKSVPKGFEDELQLRLRNVGEGSAIPIIERMFPALLAISIGGDYFDKARYQVEKVVDAVAVGESPPPEFPNHLLTKFNSFGKTLREGEFVELRKGGSKYTQELRKKIVLHSGEDYQDKTDRTGIIVSVDDVNYLFRIQLPDGNVVPGPLHGSLRELAVNAQLNRKRILVSGVGAFNRKGALVRFDEVAYISPFEASVIEGASNIGARIQELEALTPGWLDGDGVALSRPGLEWLTAFLEAFTGESQVPPPFLYPTVDGNVQGEWTIGNWEVSAVFDLSEHTADVLATDTSTGSSVERLFNLSGSGRELSEFLLEISNR